MAADADLAQHVLAAEAKLAAARRDAEADGLTYGDIYAMNAVVPASRDPLMFADDDYTTVCRSAAPALAVRLQAAEEALSQSEAWAIEIQRGTPPGDAHECSKLIQREARRYFAALPDTDSPA